MQKAVVSRSLMLTVLTMIIIQIVSRVQIMRIIAPISHYANIDPVNAEIDRILQAMIFFKWNYRDVYDVVLCAEFES